jgi:hypothetical protein
MALHEHVHRPEVHQPRDNKRQYLEENTRSVLFYRRKYNDITCSELIVHGHIPHPGCQPD